MIFSPGLVIGGKYRLERPLASGGMGSLWVARHTQLGALVAMKFMEASSTTSSIARARFEREARSAASLRSPHVVAVQDYGLDGEVPYLVMELLEGEDLRKRLNREKRLPIDAMARILAQAARGLRVAHEAKLVHRDLKPANVFLAKIDEEEVVKILDFGIAKEVKGTAVGESTRTGELMGSPHYMSPEQVRAAKDIDHRSDLWSLSVIVFRAVTGRLPFSGEVIGEVIGQILADPVPRATKVAPDLPPAIDAFFDRGFSRDREQRFQSAREMAEAFAAVAAGAGAPVVIQPSAFPAVSGRPVMASLATLHDGSLPGNPGSSLDLRPQPATLPPPMYPTGGSPLPSGDTGAPLSGALGPTGSPAIYTTPPPALPRSSGKKWGVVAGVIVAGALGAGMLVLLGGQRGGAAHPAAAPASAAAPQAIVVVPPASTAAPSLSAPPSEPTAAPGLDPATEASASASAAPVAAPRPLGKGPVKKKLRWGF